MVIKGQNLRVIIAGKCVAAAQSCNLQLQLQLEETTSKDSTNDFAEYSPVGHNWSGSVDALVTDGRYEEVNVEATHEIPGSQGESYYAPQLIPLPAGMSIHAESSQQIEIFDSNLSPLAMPATGILEYTNEGDTDISVYLGSDFQDAEIEAYTYDPLRLGAKELVQASLNGAKVQVRFSTVGGRNNVMEQQRLLEGYAYLNDLNLTAQNRTNSAYSVQIAGTGELEKVDN